MTIDSMIKSANTKVLSTRVFRGCVISLLLACSAAGSGPRAIAEEVEDANVLSGYLKAQQERRWAEWYSPAGVAVSQDRDVYFQMRLDALLGQDHPYEFHAHGAARRDLDGGSSQTGYTPLEDIGDTGTGTWRGSLYEAHLDLNYPLGNLTQLRLGRQPVTREAFLYFDGVGADLRLTSHLEAALYGGAPVRFYELAPANGQPARDSMGGLGLDYALGALNRVTLDYLRVRDQRDPLGETRDTLVALGWQQRLSATCKMNVRARGINGETRDVRLRSLGSVFTDALVFSLSYFRQMRPQNEVGTDLPVFTPILGQTEPFHSLDLKLRASLNDTVALDAGLLRREVLDPALEGPLNRSFARQFLVLDVDHLFFSGLSLSLTGERWSSRERSVTAGGFDLGYRNGARKEALRINVGSYYSLYKYDYYVLLGERSLARTYYAKVKVPAGAGFSVEGQYEYERAKGAYRTARAGVRYDY